MMFSCAFQKTRENIADLISSYVKRYSRNAVRLYFQQRPFVVAPKQSGKNVGISSKNIKIQ